MCEPRRLLELLVCALVVIWLSAAAGNASAQTVRVPDLYSARVTVPDTGAGTRIEGFRKALERVLIKVSGSEDILQSTETGPLLEKASGYVLRYSYREKSAAENDGNGRDAENKQDLNVEFDGSALEHAMHDAGLPVWSASRPSTLVWLGVQSGNNRRILSEDADSSINEALKEAAADRGVPLILPLMDLEDSRRVDYADIRGGFTENLVDAAGRYNTAMVMIGSLRRLPSGDWSVKWTVQRDDTASSWSEYGVSLDEALDSGVGGLADMLAARFAFSGAPGGEAEYLIAVDQVRTLDQYAGVLSQLSSFVFVHQVTPVRIDEDRMLFRVRMGGQLRELERALSLSDRLKRAPRARPDGSVSATVAAPLPQQGTPQAPDDDGQADLYYSAVR